MAERVPSDHPSVETLRARVARRGGTRRPEVRVPAEGADRLPADGIVRLVVDGRERHAPVERRGEGVALVGAYDSARLARERGGENRLAGWLRAGGLDPGRSVLVDVVVEEFLYGLRAPGTEAVYGAREPPAEGLRRIAERLDG